MERSQESPGWFHPRWTLGVTFLLVLINFDLCSGGWGVTSELSGALESNGVAIRHGEVWRVLTGNLVHWNPPHFYLDVGVFLVLGVLYEGALGRWFPWLLLTMGLAAGLAELVFPPPE